MDGADPGTGELTEQEVALVLRRAAEIDLRLDAPGPGLDVATVEESAVEAGLSRQSVQTALAELRVGALRPVGAVARSRWILGPATVTVRRTVPGTKAQALARLRTFLTRELFRVRRARGDQSSWSRRDDLGANVRRKVDKSIRKRLALTEVRRVELGVTAAGTGERRVMVVLQADVSRICRDRGAFVATGGALGVAVTAGSLLLGLFGDPAALLAMPIGAGAAAAGYGVGLRYYRTRVEAIETALESVLDDLEGHPSE